MQEQVQRDLGRHDARLDAMEKDLQKVNDQLKDMAKTLSQIQDTLSTAAGGWKTMMLVGGMIAAFFHMIGWLVDKAAFLTKH